MIHHQLQIHKEASGAGPVGHSVLAPFTSWLRSTIIFKSIRMHLVLVQLAGHSVYAEIRKPSGESSKPFTDTRKPPPESGSGIHASFQKVQLVRCRPLRV